MSGPDEAGQDRTEPEELLEEAAADCWLTPDLGDRVDAAVPETVTLLVPGWQGPGLAIAGMVEAQLVTRGAWGARSPKAVAQYLPETLGTKIHYTGSYINPLLLEDHRRCAPAVRDIQADHMDSNGWNDIGYTAVVCPHRYVFEGRGPHRLPAANGPGRNSAHYGVCGLVGSRGITVPMAGQLHGLRDAIEWLRHAGGAGMEIKGHRDGYATDCPGEPLYRWVRAGAPRPQDEETDMTDEQIKQLIKDVSEATARAVVRWGYNDAGDTVGEALQTSKNGMETLVPMVHQMMLDVDAIKTKVVEQRA